MLSLHSMPISYSLLGFNRVKIGKYFYELQKFN